LAWKKGNGLSRDFKQGIIRFPRTKGDLIKLVGES